jgi:ubiquinone/menaquinone biosynthesis C-methylase UbiE
MVSKKAVRDYYSSISSGYDELYGEEQSAKLGEVLNSLRLGADDIILDVGCGTGALTRRMCGGVKRVVGIDICREMVERCGSCGPELLVCDAESLPFRPRTFDKVISLTVLQNLEDPARALSEMVRVCQGFVALTFLRDYLPPERIERLLGQYLSPFSVFEIEKDYMCIGGVRPRSP